MPNRKRKSSAVPDISSQARSITPSASPSVSRHKRVKRVSVTATQQLQSEQEEAHHESTQEQQVLMEEDNIDVAPGRTNGSKRAGKGLTVNVEKPHTPPDTLSPDVGHPPIHFSPLREATGVHAQHQVIRSHLNEHFDAADVEAAVLASQDKSLGTPLLLSPAVVTSHQATPSRPDPTAELEVQRFEKVTTTLHHEIASVQAAMQILVTELQALGFAEANASTDVILASIRTAFRDARMQLNELLPQADANSCSNGDLLPLLTANLRSLLLTIGDQTQIIKDMKIVEQVQTEKQLDLLEKLTALEHRKKELQTTLHKTDMLADQRAKEVVSLEDEIRDLRDQCEKQAADIANRDATIEALDDDVLNVQAEADGLEAELNETRQSLVLTQATLTKLEQDHKQRVGQMERDHTAAIDELQDVLVDEQASRDAIERDDQDKAERIVELETEIGDLNGDMETLKVRLAESKEQTEAQIGRNEILESQLDERQTFITQLEIKIEEAEQKLDDLVTELEELRSVANSERRQREAAEEELDERNATIETLNTRVKESGLEANQLRSKLFEAQQRREKEVNELQELIATNQDQFETDLAAEQEARAAAADRVDELTNVIIPDLELKIEKIEDDSEQALAAKNDLLVESETVVRELRDSFQQAKKLMDDYTDEKEREILALHSDIAQINSDLNNRNDLIQRLEAQGLEDAKTHRDAMAINDTIIQDLEKKVEILQGRVVSLEKENSSLEQRVDNEATELAIAQNDHADAVAELTASIKTRDHEIGKLLHESKVAREEYEETLTGRDERINNLEELADGRKVEVDTLVSINKDLKQTLVEAVQLSRAKISSVNAITAAAHDASQQEEQALLHDTEVLLQKAEAMSTTVTVTQQSETYVPQRRSPRVTRKTAKKRVHDSGIFDINSDGPEESTQEMEEIMA